MRQVGAAVWVLVLVLAFGPTTFADTVHLKDGRVLTGRLIPAGTAYRLQGKFGSLIIRKSEILRIEKGPLPKDDPAPGGGAKKDNKKHAGGGKTSPAIVVAGQGALLRAACSNQSAEAHAEKDLIQYRFYTFERNAMHRTKFRELWTRAIDWWIEEIHKNCGEEIRITRARDLGLQEKEYRSRKADLTALRHGRFSTGAQTLSNIEKRQFLEGKDALVAAIGRKHTAHRTFNIGLFSEVKAKPRDGKSGSVPGVWMLGTNVLAADANAMSQGAAPKHEIGHLFGLLDQDGGIMDKHYSGSPGTGGWYGRPGEWDPKKIGWTAKIKKHLDGAGPPPKKRRPVTGLPPGPLVLSGDTRTVAMPYEKPLPGKTPPRRKGSLTAGAQDVADQMDAKPPGKAGAELRVTFSPALKPAGKKSVLTLRFERSEIKIDENMPAAEKPALHRDREIAERDLDATRWRCRLSEETTALLRREGTITIPWDAIQSNSPFRNLQKFKKPEFDIVLRLATVRKVRFVQKQKRRLRVLPDKGVLLYDEPFYVEVALDGAAGVESQEIQLTVDGLAAEPVTVRKTQDPKTLRSDPLVLHTP